MSSTVSPSGAARATISVPITVPAPARFSTMVSDALRLTDLLRQHARDDVGAAAGRERHDDLQRAAALRVTGLGRDATGKQNGDQRGAEIGKHRKLPFQQRATFCT